MDTLKKIWSNIIKFFKKKPKKEKKPRPKWLIVLGKTFKALVLTGLFTGIFCGLAFAWWAFIYLDDEFDLSQVDNALNYTSVVYAKKDGAFVEAEVLHGGENRIWVNIEDIPKDLQHAFVAIEDERFYTHSGVDLKRTAAAVLNFVNPSSSQTFGGSTITQQVIKNLTGDDEQTVSRKVQEIRRAWYVEREYKKDQILEVYLNTIYLSRQCNGVQTAAEYYFGKELKDLTLLECASIASITNLPSYYDPVSHPENNLKRAHLVLDKMLEWDYITEEEHKAAKEEELKLNVGGKIKEENVDPTEINSYFVDQVISDVVDALVEEKGYTPAYANALVFSGGLQIYSTMDMGIQATIDKYYKDPSNFPKITSKVKVGGETVTQTPQSAMVIIDNSTGAVVGMAGGIGEKTTARGHNRATQSYLQPGSCMKPIGTYGPAIEYGAMIDGVKVAPGLMVLDKGIMLGGKLWPKNYNGVSEKMMSVQAAVSASTNTVAVRVNQALGASKSFNFLKNNLGVTTLIPGSNNDENASAMALGGLTKGISVLEITAAYEAFPNEGTYIKPYTFTKVCDQNGRVILENRVESNVAMKANTARIMNQMLETACSSGTGTTARFSGTAVAGKTGTTNDDKDRWFVGYTGYYTAAVWFGYDKPATVVYGGANPAAVTFKKIMSEIHKGLAYKGFADPTGLGSAEVCAETGMVPNEKCEHKVSGLYIAGSYPTKVCDKCGVNDPNAKPEDQNKPATNPDNGGTTKPDNGGTTKPDDGTKPKPDDGGGKNPKPDDGGTTKPDDGGGKNPDPTPDPGDGGGDGGEAASVTE